MQYKLAFALLLVSFYFDSSTASRLSGRSGNDEPCSPHYSDSCIRDYLMSHSDCKPVDENNNGGITRKRATSYLSYFNASVKYYDSTIYGLQQGEVVSFYINKAKDLVYAVHFDEINLDHSAKSECRFYSRAREPVVIRDIMSVTHKSVTLTATIKMRDEHLDLEGAVVIAYADEISSYTVGSKLRRSKEPVVQSTLNAIDSNLDIATQEALLPHAYDFFIMYLENKICDFGINS